MESNGTFHCEIENSPDDERGNKVTMVRFRGRLASESADEMKKAVKPLIPLGGRVIIDMSDLNYLDSSGLGALVGLKASAVYQGLCILEFVNMTPRILDLLRVTKLVNVFSS
jgi:anti-sigma B factor antagonist